MSDRWYRNSVFYSLDVRTFQDSNGDGVGDLPGLIGRLDYLSWLGATTMWLNPIHPSPWRDGGYDITDYYGIHPTLGTSGEFAELLNEADSLGIRVMLDLVVNHSSDEHPWFVSARADRDSPYRDFYVWSDTEPADRHEGMVFPGVQTETWTHVEETDSWYRHKFYDFEPDLATGNPRVREEIDRITAFWLRLGVSGFRMDAAPFVIEERVPGTPNGKRHYEYLGGFRRSMNWHRGDAVVLAEANVPDSELPEFFGEADGAANRLQMIFAFALDQATVLALARADRAPLVAALAAMPELPVDGQWATFLRNHDEIDLGNLAEDERADVFAAFGPDKDMQIYGRGLRRRLASMLGGDRRRIELAYSLQFTEPGTPVLRYGEEIGMSERLDLPEREALRTPMQWTGGSNGGFSTAEPDQLYRPLVTEGPYAFGEVNVADQRRQRDSLVVWFTRMLHTLRDTEQIGTGKHTVLPYGPDHVFVHRAAGDDGTVLFLHNLADTECTVDVSDAVDDSGELLELFGDDDYGSFDPAAARLNGYGYRWVLLSGQVG